MLVSILYLFLSSFNIISLLEFLIVEKWSKIFDQAGVVSKKKDYVEKLLRQSINPEDLFQFDQNFIRDSLKDYMDLGDVLKVLIFVSKI